MSRDASTMTIPQLKEELKKYGEPVGGTKQVLVDRLQPLIDEDEELGADLTVDEKFWKLVVTGNETTVSFGKIGSNGQTQVKVHDSIEEARKYAEKQKNDKLKKGYTDANAKPSGRGKKRAAAPAAAAPAPKAAPAAAAAPPAKKAKAGVPDTDAPLGVVDPVSGLAKTGKVHSDNGQIYDCMLNQLNLSTNTDKYYIAQVIDNNNGKEYFCFTHWGRTGLVGQSMLDGPYDDVTDAIEIFEEKFREKTGNEWSDRTNFTPVTGKYDLLKTDYEALASKAAATWQYYMAAPQDGKKIGWYDYDQAASDIVEALHDMFLANEMMNVRIVQSGDWSYRVDLTKMTQTNTSTQKERPIRRVALSSQPFPSTYD